MYITMQGEKMTNTLSNLIYISASLTLMPWL